MDWIDNSTSLTTNNNNTHHITSPPNSFNPLAYEGGLDNLISRIEKESRSIERQSRRLESNKIADDAGTNESMAMAMEVEDGMEKRKRMRLSVRTQLTPGLDENLALWMDKLASPEDEEEEGDDLKTFPSRTSSPSSSPPNLSSCSSSSLLDSPLSSSLPQLSSPSLSFAPISPLLMTSPQFFTGGGQALVGNFREELHWDGDITPTFSPSTSNPIVLPTPVSINLESSTVVEEYFDDDLWEKDSFNSSRQSNRSSGEGGEWEMVDSPIQVEVGLESISDLSSTPGILSPVGSEVAMLMMPTNGSNKIRPRKLQKRSHSGRGIQV